MSFTYGFYDSLNGDRVYNAEQFGSIFDGVINDGVYMNIGDSFKVTPGTGLSVKVGTGRAWFKHTWTLNTAQVTLSLDTANAYNPRKDLIVIRVDKRAAYRQNSLAVITGTPSADPQRPSFNNSDDIYDFPIAEITVDQAATSITSSKILNMVGNTGRCPYVTSPTGVVDISTLTDRFTAAWDEWYADETTTDHAEFDSWRRTEQAEYEEWFAGLVEILSGDEERQLAALEGQIIDLQTSIENNDFIMALVDDDGNFIVSDEPTVEEGAIVYIEKICGDLSYALSGDDTCLEGLFIVKTFTYSGTIYPGEALGITRADLGAATYDGTPSGYVPFAISRVNPGNTWVICVAENAHAANGGNMVVLRNLYTQYVDFTATIDVTFVKTKATNI